MILSLLLFFFSLLINTYSASTDRAASRTERRIEKRLSRLDGYVAQALEEDRGEWLQFNGFPDDMVLYRYVYDTLQCWCNQFTVSNDDISSKLVFHGLGNYSTSLSSPLSDIGEGIKYMNLGPKWYLVKSVSDGAGCRIIAGLEIKNSMIEDLRQGRNGTNAHLGLSRKFSVSPISESGGSVVQAGGVPVFKIHSETAYGFPFVANSILRWLSLLMICIASVLYLRSHRTAGTYALTMLLLAILSAIAYIWGLQMQDITAFFSPSTYADGEFFYSFGALATTNIAICLAVFCTYSMRNEFMRKIGSGKSRRTILAAYGLTIVLIFAATAFYMAYSLHSLIMNSGITLELYIWSRISVFTVIVYITYSGILMCLLMLIQMLSQVSAEFTGKTFSVFTTRSLAVFSIICAGYFTVTSGILGFRKEQNRVMVLANRLAVDRDIELELQLRSVEDAIAADPIIATLSMAENTGGIILNRIAENYLNRISQTYDIKVSVCKGSDSGCLLRADRFGDASSPIAPNSRFLYTYDTGGYSGYIGRFPYYSAEYGISWMFVEISSGSNRERGYYSIFDRNTLPGGVDIPRLYSYAKYSGGALISYKGNYAYPTVIYGSLKKKIDAGASSLKINGYRHFINKINDNETIIVSRKIRGVMTYIVTFSYLVLVILTIMHITLHRTEKFSVRKAGRNYYRTRINTVLFIALFATLTAMAVLSVTFVQKRNEANMYDLMSNKISTIQAMFESRCGNLEGTAELNGREFKDILERIGSDTKSDITLYSPGGKVFRSTTPEIFGKMMLGARINEEAYYSIRYRSQRYYIRAEKFGDNRYYSLYAPIINHSGKLLAIINTPYTEQNYDFKQEAMFHAAAILNIFLLLLVFSLAISTYVVNGMFGPLEEMGRKMGTANIHDPEYIIYRRKDEISTLVDAYNRMVHDLSENTKALARSERDKAWSEMARQVAHEIKNPLTPIKLEIQRLIRQKQKNDPAWETRFDEVARIVLDHIDILTDTANEFSTFAKLYTEEPVLLDLDRILRDQIYIFDNKENISITYFGLQDAVVLAPRPQLIRVFVNLITNAVQALEIQRGTEDVQEPGRIVISLRNATADGWYDIVVEDNGPGVREENQSRLFTPDFTTKSGGTGLGLAICRNIVEKCGGEISYRRSFALGGACFTVTLPKHA